MSISEFLERRHIPFEIVPHSECFGAQHLAATLHLPGRQIAKTVLLRSEHDYSFFVVVLPATHRVDINRLQTFLGGTHLELASEQEIAKHCPDCEMGVLPPFGTHFGAQTIVDQSLADDEFIAFDCHSHTDAIRLKYADFVAIEHPLVACFAEQLHDAKL